MAFCPTSGISTSRYFSPLNSFYKALDQDAEFDPLYIGDQQG